jgi:benzylsuccinate CoA-transferase BbsE subunit
MADTDNSTALLPGFRVLDLTSSMGAFCGKLLRDLGMDVIKVEPPGGDPTRSEPPFANGRDQPERSLRFAYLNAGKRSITLNIANETGRKVLLDLVTRSDIVLEDFEPGHLAGQGLGYDALLERNSKLILVSLTGFGQNGPYAHYKAPDIVGTAMGGLLYISGDPKLTPCNPPETQSYYYASLFAAYGTMRSLAAGNAGHRRVHRRVDSGQYGASRTCRVQLLGGGPGNEARRQPASAQRAGQFVSVQERLDRPFRDSESLASIA